VSAVSHSMDWLFSLCVYVCESGVDGRYSEGMREFANYLLFDIFEPRQQHSLQVFSLTNSINLMFTDI